MKKNITINLCGRLFQIDEDAYDMLHQYTNSLRSHFKHMEGGEEIADDIESRIAELLDELKAQGDTAITIDHIRGIISQIGQPEQMDEAIDNHDESASTEGHKGAEYAQSILQEVTHRKFYRNPNDKMLAGVLSGLACSFGIDPTILRIATVLLTFFYGSGLIAYIILALVIPEARTPEQVLQMQNKPVTPQNLAGVVIENKQPQSYGLLHRIFSFLLKICMGFFLGIAILSGFALAICAVVIVVSFITIFTVPTASLNSLPFNLGELNLPELFAIHPWVVVLFVVGLLLILLIPIYAIAHMLLTKSGKTQPMGMVQRIVWIALWLASFCSFIPAMIYLQDVVQEHYTEEYNRTHTYQGIVMEERDIDYLKQGEWTVVKHENCHHYTWSGHYFTGDENIRFLDSYDWDCSHVYQVEHKQKVVPGVYKLVCNGRAEGRGCYIYAVGDNKQLAEIPPYGDEGGELIEHFRRTKSELDSLVEIGQEPKWKQELCDKIIAGKDGKGYGWSTITIDNIVVTQNDSIAYGVSNDATFTDHPCRSKWFSAVDFTLTHTGDLPKK